MDRRTRLTGPLSGVGASRVAWDPTGQVALTLSGDDRLLGLSLAEDVVEAEIEVSDTLSWDPGASLLTVIGGRLLVDTSGVARLDVAGGELHLAADLTRLAVHRRDGSLAVLHHTGQQVFGGLAEVIEWSPAEPVLLAIKDQGVAMVDPDGTSVAVADAGDRGPLNARWSPGGSSIVVWGAHGPFEIRDPDGSLLLAFPAHAGRNNLAAVLGGRVLVTSGDDHLLAVHDALAGVTVTSVDLPQPAVWLELDEDEDLLLVELLDGTVAVHEVPSLRPVPLRRPANQARWSPTVGGTLALCDGTDLWLESWDR